MNEFTLAVSAAITVTATQRSRFFAKAKNVQQKLPAALLGSEILSHLPNSWQFRWELQARALMNNVIKRPLPVQKTSTVE